MPVTSLDLLASTATSLPVLPTSNPVSHQNIANIALLEKHELPLIPAPVHSSVVQPSALQHPFLNSERMLTIAASLKRLQVVWLVFIIVLPFIGSSSTSSERASRPAGRLSRPSKL